MIDRCFRTARAIPIASLLLVGVATAAVGAQAGAQGNGRKSEPAMSAADQDLLATSNRWFTAFIGGDANVLKELETDDFLIVQQTNRGLMMMEKSAQLENIHNNSATRSPIRRELTNVKIRRHGSTAILTGLATLRGAPSRGAEPPQGLVTEVWMNQDGRWRIAHFQPTDVPLVPAAK